MTTYDLPTGRRVARWRSTLRGRTCPSVTCCGQAAPWSTPTGPRRPAWRAW
ncbi:hypothetical protein [Micromonospora sp. RTGN7]|uniref:hypothetical protein n=1 Tax=Micromonospora sp. RTGN7 TaxID=3016526 RepID=UPI0029FEEE90|nr:hypothetical protein [Micromonospora sp. RTGN7]